jgi:hypothetical protein
MHKYALIYAVLVITGAAQAQTLTTVASFGPSDPSPNTLIQGADGA